MLNAEVPDQQLSRAEKGETEAGVQSTETMAAHQELKSTANP